MKIIGVDLGTTNSCVYALDDQDKPQLVLTSGKYKIFPSVVWAAGPDKEVLVGHAAKVRIGQHPAPIIAVKRKMGTTDAVSLGGTPIKPHEASTHILRHIKRQVEEVLQDQIGGVIVTVPAYFDAAPKNDTHRAAIDAFFDGDTAKAEGRIQLQLEPEAAAYAYAAEDPEQHLRVLVYDLGGGTFDVTVLEKSREGVTALKFGGDPHLGGDNIDDRVASWFLYLLRGGRAQALDRLLDDKRYPAEIRYTILQQVLSNDVEALDGRLRPEDRDLLIGPTPPALLDLDDTRPEDLRRIQVLKRLAEVAKIELTTSPEAVVAKQGAFEDQKNETVDIDLTLSRSDFDRLIGDFIETTVEATQRVLAESGHSASTIDRVLLVGGSSRMPVVRQTLERLFTCPILLSDPDLIVARGAALRALQLNPPPLDGSGAGLRLTYPRETFEDTIEIRGRLPHDGRGHAYLLHDQREIADAPVGDGVFVLANIPLQANQQNRFKIEVVDERENPVLDQEIVIRHDERAIGGTDRLAPKITQPIRALSTQGFFQLFAEGQTLPITKPFVCHRATLDDHIDIEFYEGNRPLASLHIAQVDPRLPIGAPIDLEITVADSYAVSASAVVRETSQKASVAFEITHLKIPPLKEMDEDMAHTLAQIDNDLALVRDVNERAVFASRGQRLAAEYDKARTAMEKDGHKLFSTIGDARKLLIDIRAAQMTLEPPIEEFDKAIQWCRGLAKRLQPSSVTTRKDVEERVNSLERAGHKAWEAEDAVEWKHVTNEVRNLLAQLHHAANKREGDDKRPPRSPEQTRADMVDSLAEIREQAKAHDLLERFDEEIAATERAVKAVELRDEDKARNALNQIHDRSLLPLAHRVEKAITEVGGQVRPTTAKVTF
jgi:actin-like ATPase involved in cell morphogenesis